MRKKIKGISRKDVQMRMEDPLAPSLSAITNNVLDAVANLNTSISGANKT